MANVPVMPDALKAVIPFLQTHSYVVAKDVDRIATDLTGYVQGQKWIVVTDAPGTSIDKRRLDAQGIDVNVYAESRGSAKDLARVVRAALASMKNYYDSNLVVTEVETNPPFDMTDLVNKQPRYTFDATVYCRPR